MNGRAEPTCLLVTFLSLTRLSERSNGTYRRLSLLARAIRASGASLRVQCVLTPEEADASVGDACREIEGEIRRAWGMDATVVATTIDPPRSTPWIAQQFSAIFGYGNLAFIRSRVTNNARALTASELMRRPSFVIAHRLPAMFALNSIRDAHSPIVFDLDDVEHVVAIRAAQQVRLLRTKAFEWLALPSLLLEERRSVARATRTLVCSSADAERVSKLFRVTNLDVLPNAMPIPPRVGPLVANPVILMVGAYDYEPNADAAEFFINEVFPIVRASSPKAEVRLVGASPERMPSFARTPNGVTFCGFVADLDREYTSARVVICPIRYGGGTRVKLVEAAGWGKPIVSTTVGAEGLGMVNGVHAMIADSSQTFADGCIRLLTDDAECAKLSHAARALAEESFDAERVAGRLGEVLRGYVDLRLAQ
jgi:glycosyltransferase involved in cell wall biosynthesis